MRTLTLILTLSGMFSMTPPNAQAADLNLVNIDLGSQDARRAEQLYGNAYGFQPQQVTPALLAPAEEVPAIMQIAQAAGTVPLSVMMMRKMGMSYSSILQNFAVAPLVSMGSPITTDTNYIERTRTHFLQNILQVNPSILPNIPLRGPEFTRFLIYPVHRDYGYWMPPGIAKKYGMWIPPGQAKKMGLWGGPGKKGKGGYYVVDDDGDVYKVKKGKWHGDKGWKKAEKEHGHYWKDGKGHGKHGD